MTMRNKIILLLVGLLLTLASCTKDAGTEGVPVVADTACPVTFRLETEAADGIVPLNEPFTRIERPVTDLNFLVYGDGGLVCSGYLLSSMIPTMKLAPGTYRVYAVANFGCQLGQISEEDASPRPSRRRMVSCRAMPCTSRAC